jgi:hypothetical protein
MSAPIRDKLACVQRELALRRAVYGKRVLQGKMKQAEADREIAVMEAIVRDYERSSAAAQADAGIVVFRDQRGGERPVVLSIFNAAYYLTEEEVNGLLRQAAEAVAAPTPEPVRAPRGRSRDMHEPQRRGML